MNSTTLMTTQELPPSVLELEQKLGAIESAETIDQRLHDITTYNHQLTRIARGLRMGLMVVGTSLASTFGVMGFLEVEGAGFTTFLISEMCLFATLLLGHGEISTAHRDDACWREADDTDYVVLENYSHVCPAIQDYCRYVTQHYQRPLNKGEVERLKQYALSILHNEQTQDDAQRAQEARRRLCDLA